MHSHQLQSDDAEQVNNNPWISPSNDGETARHDLGGNRGDDFEALTLTSISGVTTLQNGDMILSPSPPPSVQPTRAQPPMQDVDTIADPHSASLKAIFPDFDDAVILGVLESTDNDHDRALDVLLGMSDPSFVPPISSPPPSQSPRPNQFQSDPSLDVQRLSQEALDEQFARRLALEEQEQARVETFQDTPSYLMYQPYQIRRGGGGGRNGSISQPQQSQTPVQGGKDTMTEFQEGFNRIAESGKKTFSSIMSKVRAKMQEFDQGQGWSGTQNPPRDQVPQQSSSAWPQQTYAQPYANPQRQPSQSRYPSSLPRSEVVRPTSTEPAQPSYYDPNTRGYDLYGDDDRDEIQITDNTVAPPPMTTPNSSAAAPSTVTQNHVTTQNPTMSPHIDNPSLPSTASLPPSAASPVLTPSTSNPRLSSTTPPARSLSPTITGKGTPGPGGVDFSKLGLLPKRPISLVRPQSPADTGVSPARLSITDSESTLASPTAGRHEPEFVENPFEDPN